MKQFIVAIIRPRLNLSSSKNQTAHLVEHLLLRPERKQLLGLSGSLMKSLVGSYGYITENYCAEYYIVTNKNAATEVKNKIVRARDTLAIDEKNFHIARKGLIQELRQKASTPLGLEEQYERAIYEARSPAVQEKWFDSHSLENTTVEEAANTFRQLREPAYVTELSFENYLIEEKLHIKKNQLKKELKRVNLFHPFQNKETAEVNILLPLPNKDSLLTTVYSRVLTGWYADFGILRQVMHYEKGLVYGIDCWWNAYANCLQISFPTAMKDLQISLNALEYALSQFEKRIDKVFELAKDRLVIEYRLDWANLASSPLFYLEEAILVRPAISPFERIKQLKDLDIEKLSDYNKAVILNMQKSSITVTRVFGNEPKEEFEYRG